MMLIGFAITNKLTHCLLYLRIYNNIIKFNISGTPESEASVQATSAERNVVL